MLQIWVQPFRVPKVAGVASGVVGAAPQHKPVEQAEFAYSSWPFVPTVRAAGLAVPRAVTMSPLAKRIEQGIPDALAVDHNRAVPVEDRIWPAVPVVPAQSKIEVTVMSPGVSMVPPSSKRTSPT